MVVKFINFLINESSGNIKFTKKKRKKGNKTDIYDVTIGGILVGVIKWTSRMRGYAYQPIEEYNVDVNDFIKDLMSKYRADKKKAK